MLIKYNPFSPFSMSSFIDRQFDSFNSIFSYPSLTGIFNSNFNMFEYNKDTNQWEYSTSAFTGIDKENIKIEIGKEDKCLYIYTQYKVDNNSNNETIVKLNQPAIYNKHIELTISLPKNIDTNTLQASYTNGMLFITVNSKPEEVNNTKYVTIQ